MQRENRSFAGGASADKNGARDYFLSIKTFPG